MSFEFDLRATCNHVVDEVQYWGYDFLTSEEYKFLQVNPEFRSKLMTTLAYDICPRCDGRGWYWDIQIARNESTPGALANPKLTRKNAKLKQEVTKMISTYLGDNPFHPFYGVGYQKFIGTRIIPGRTETDLWSLTDEAFTYLVGLHNQQKTYQTVDGEEVLASFDNMNVNYDPNSPTAFYINIFIRNAVNQSLDTSTKVGIGMYDYNKQFLQSDFVV